jgi:MFS family permease
MRVERSAAAPLGLTVIVALYMAHALPLYFYNVAVPAILRSQGVDLRWIGMLSLLYLPWAFKFLWAPLVDRWHLPRIGRRRSWLWLTQLLLLVGILALAATGLDHGLGVFLAVGLWISTIAATQDIAIDGYTVEALAPAEHRLGSMAQSVGVALGSMVGGAGVLWLYETRGWNVALLTLAAMSALTLLAVQAVQEQPRPAEQPRPSVLRALRRPSMRWALLLIVLYRLVEAPAMAMINPLLVDQQWSLTDIGLLISVTGAGIGMLAAVAAAWLLKRRSAELPVGSGRLGGGDAGPALRGHDQLVCAVHAGQLARAGRHRLHAAGVLRAAAVLHRRRGLRLPGQRLGLCPVLPAAGGRIGHRPAVVQAGDDAPGSALPFSLTTSPRTPCGIMRQPFRSPC